MERIVQPELLDELPARDKRALRSRRDIRRLNRLMGHAGILAGVLGSPVNRASGRRVVELGAGDGHFLLSVARRLRRSWPAAEATLVDRLDVVEPCLSDGFGRLGWRLRVEVAEAAEWLRKAPSKGDGAMICNLLLHQIESEPLKELVRLAAPSARVFVALEPRRAWWPHFCSRFLRLAGCGSVTRHDAPVSVRAGFAGRELSEIWPQDGAWELTERRAGIFSHVFVARRRKGTP